MLPLANIFQPLIDFFEAILKFFHQSLGFSWGFSIITLTIVIRAALVPLTLKQLRSMHQLQRLQPQMKALQAKYKGDKQRLNEEMMKFYKEHKVNPFGSCLPMVAQVPVFISLFYMLRKDLRFDICGQTAKACSQVHGIHDDPGFLFVHDLTGAATGAVLVVLMVLYVGSTLGSSLLMSATADKTQRNIMLFLPLVFVTFVIRFPAGVVVYWITTNMWTIGQGYLVRRKMGPLRPAVAVAGDGGGGGGLSGMLARAMGRDAEEAPPANGRPTKRGAAEPAAIGAGSKGATAKGSAGGGGSAKGAPSRGNGGGAKGTKVRGSAGGGAGAEKSSTADKGSTTKNGAGKGATAAKGAAVKGAAGKGDAARKGAASENGANGSAKSGSAGKPPPPSPRKKKKRSGRRR